MILLAAVVLGAGSSLAREEAEPAITFLEDDAALYVAQLTNLGGYELGLVYEIYFHGSEPIELQTGTSEDGLPLFESREVAELSQLRPEGAALLACLEEICRPLPAEQKLLGGLGPGDPSTFVRFTLRDAARAVRRGEDLRLVAKPGWVLSDSSPSPRLTTTLPQLGESEKLALASHPLLSISLSPMTMSENSEEDSDAEGASLTFSGGIHVFRRNHRRALTYSGSIATEAFLALDALRFDAEAERNLFAGRGDFLPLKLRLGAEADRSFDLVNGVLGVSLSYLLPWNANFSPRDAGYIPNLGPLLSFEAELGQQLEQAADNPAAATAPEDFQRAGYSLRWRLPVARNTVLRLHHAGTWVFSDEEPKSDFHRLWDVALETRVGNLTYEIGYQEGEAAPLFEPVETTRVGVVLRLGQHLQCEQRPGGTRLQCNRPTG